MQKACLLTLALAGLSLCHAPLTRATTIAQNFASNPLQNGWQIFGDTNSFTWDSTNQQLAVTWDSRRTNSFFYHLLPWYLTRNDDFALEFDLRLSDITTDVEPGKSTPIQLGFGFLNYEGATSTNFMRGSYGNAPNVAEFDYYAKGYYVFLGETNDSAAATSPGFISATDSFAYAPIVLSVYDNVIPTNQSVHVVFQFAASNQTAVITVATTTGPLGSLPGLVLTTTNGFKDSDDFHVDMFSVSSYSSAGDDYDSILAHGTVDNIVVNLPPPAQNLRGKFANGSWQVQFSDQLGWNYVLERTTNWHTWLRITAPVAGNGTNLVLLDTNAPAANAFYRVSAARP